MNKRYPYFYALGVLVFFLGIGIFVHPAEAHASEFGLTWDGTHFASTTPTTGSFCLTDYPYDTSYGAYGAGVASPTSSSDFSTWSVNIANALATAIAHGKTSGDFYIQDCLTPSTPTQFAIFHVGGGGTVTPISLDGDESTHVISVNSPALYSTTTSPVAVNFTWRQGDSTPSNGYRLNFTNTLTHQFFSSVGSFEDGSAVGNNTESTTTPLTGDGTWKLSVSLLDWSPDVPQAPQFVIDTSYEVWFGLNFNDNVTTVTMGPACEIRDPVVCEISFAGTFDAGECIKYLIIPNQCTAAQTFGQIPSTLATKFPFAYAYGINDMRVAMFTASSTASTSVAVTVPTFGTITFLSKSMIEAVPFASTIKIILTALMWLVTLELLYVTLLRSHNNQTGV